jgi:membrane protease YdiL (CAAX protease family)
MTDDTTVLQSYLDWSDKGKASFWRYAVGTVLAVFVFFVLSGMVLVPFTLLVPDYAKSPTLSAVAMMLAFVISFLAIPLIVRLGHKRPWWSVAMPTLRFRAWDFLTGLWVAFVVAALAALLFQATGTMPILRNPKFDLPALLVLAVVGFVGIFIQAGAEELLFRGYFTQFVRRYTSSRILFLGIPALLFAAPHVSNIAVLGGGPLVMAPYFISGLLYGWAAYRSGSLWMSVALHLVNNYTGLVFLGTKGDVLPSAAPYLVQVPSLPITTVVVLLQSAVTVLALNYLMTRAARQA